MKANGNLPNPPNKKFSFSFFHSLWSKDSTVITLHDLYQLETSSRWKPQTELYRKLKQRPERENEAKMTKEAMPAVILEGTCRPRCSHAAANLERMSSLAMYDLDHCGERTGEIKTLVRRLPYVAYAHSSISGEGLKIVVYLDVNTPEEYPLAYAICQQTLERITGHPCDKQCARITQPCSCVWDPDAHYNPSPDTYPWREELATDPSLAQLVQSSPYKGQSSPYPSQSPQHQYASAGSGAYFAGSGSKSSAIPPPTEACGYIETFVRTFFQYHPWQKGNRHESMLALGRSARRKGFSKEELERLTNIMSVTIVGDGYTLKELQKDLFTGYQYVDQSYTPTNTPNLLTALTTDNYMLPGSGHPSEEEEELSIKNEEIRATAPYISDDIYPHLPDLLKEALKPTRNKRERDILLLGVLTNLSGCMPEVRTLFDQRIISPHLYLLVIAPPASGKGILSLAAMIPNSINNHLKEENKNKKKAYEQEVKTWEENHNQHLRKGRLPAGPSAIGMPEEPVYRYICGAPNTSKNQIICRLKTNGDLGLIINATELDMMSGAIKQDYGKHDDVFRAAFHHETAATDYKTDKQMIYVENPRLSLCLSGTPNQLPAFIRSTDNGFYGRFLIYTCEAHWKYRSAAPIKGQEDYNTLYKRLSRQVLDMFLFFQQSPTEVTLTDSQWEEHTAYFERLLDEVTSEQANAPGDIVLRASLIVVRIAAILTAIRKSESSMRMKEYICTDEDFHTAMQIVHATVGHSLLLSSSLPKGETKPQQMKLYFQIRSVINELPETFTYKEIRDKALTKNICERSLCRYLKKFTELGYIENQGGKYKKLKRITDK